MTEFTTNDFFPLLSNMRFGNDLFANFGQSRATISGNALPSQNDIWAGFEPVQFPNLFGGIDIPVPVPAPVPSPYPHGFEQDTAKGFGGGADSGENRLLHLFKLQFVALVALVLLAIGLYILSQKTAIGQKVQSKALEAAEVAALV